MNRCTHEIWEKDSAIADGMCPLCLSAELTALRNRYSTECPECRGRCEVGRFRDDSVEMEIIPCPRCGGAGRIPMLDAEEVKCEFEEDRYGDSKWNAALKMVLEGKR